MMSNHRTPLVDQIFGSNKAPIEDVLDADFADLQREAEDAAEAFRQLPAKVKCDADQIAIGTQIAKARALIKKIDHTRAQEGAPLFDAKKKVDAHFKDIAAIVAREADAAQGMADAYARQKAEEARERARREADEARAKADAERAKAETAKSSTAAGNAAGRAEMLDAKADEYEARAEGASADLTRMRAGGVTASARDVFEFTITNEDALFESLGPLGTFFTRADVEKAIRSAVRVQKERAKIPGVKVYKTVKSTFR